MIDFLPKAVLEHATQELVPFGDKIITPEVFEWMEDAETNLPYIEQQDLWGHPRNKLITSEGWRRLKEFGVREGLLATFYDGEYPREFARIVGFAKHYLFSPSSAMVTCPFAMTDGCARVCQLMGPFEASGDEYYKRLSSRDPEYSWTSGQWMTERPGGSDVSNTETVAETDTQSGSKQYKLSGFKWFSSATDSQVTITLARIGDDKRLSCFLVPVTENVRSGKIVMNRLKRKFGTKALPTAELELREVNGELIGDRGRGVVAIANVLNITRVYSAVGSTGNMARALSIAREYSRVRKVFGRKLCEIPSHVKGLAEQTILLRGLNFLGFYACQLLGAVEAGKASVSELTLARVVPGIAKAYNCKRTTGGISECMEALGGVGYLEFDMEFNIGKLLRDNQVNTIWEGTTNVLSDDFVRFLMNNSKGVADALSDFFNDRLGNIEDVPEHERQPEASAPSLVSPNNTSGSQSQVLAKLKRRTSDDLASWFAMVDGSSGNGTIDVSAGMLSQHAREYVFQLAEILISVLLVSDAARQVTGDVVGDSVALEAATRWVLRDLSRSAFDRSSLYVGPDEQINKLIVYGDVRAKL